MRKKVHIKKSRLVLLPSLIAIVVTAGYKSKMSYPAEPVSVQYVIFLITLLGLVGYCVAFVGKPQGRARRSAQD
jgi:hypothetical protein